MCHRMFRRRSKRPLAVRRTRRMSNADGSSRNRRQNDITTSRRRCAGARTGPCRHSARLHAVGQPHHVGVRRRARRRHRARSHAPRGSRRVHGRCLGTADRRARHRARHRRSRARQRGRRALHGRDGRVARRAAVGTRAERPARHRRIPGDAAGGNRGTPNQAGAHQRVRRRHRARSWPRDPHRAVGTQRTGAFEPADRLPRW